MNAHTQEASTTSQPQLARAEGLWFLDGGLIIQAETTLFRVYRDLLAVHSVVFRDMLSIPTPEDAERMEGCPLVRLPDSAEDITYFLKALLYPEFFERFPVPTTFRIVAGVLRMSHKYDVDALRKRALVHLSTRFPRTLDGWDAKRAEINFYGTLPSLVAVVILARQADALWVLPAAFYRLCAESNADSYIINGECDFELSAADKLVCMSGVRTLETTFASKVLDFLWHPLYISGCQSPAVCLERKTVARSIAEKERMYSPTDTTVHLLPFDIWGRGDWPLLNLCCQPCLAAMKVEHKKARQSVWDGLPAMFGLPAWDELEQMRAEALK